MKVQSSRSAAYFISKEIVETAKEKNPTYLRYALRAFDEFFDWKVSIYCICKLPGRREDTFESSLAVLPQEALDVLLGIVR